jgi:hypothetical protein
MQKRKPSDHMVLISKTTLLMSLSSLFFGCTSVARVEPSNLESDLFLNPDKHVGEHVVIRGFMHYKFENRNLFPSKQHVDSRHCLPLLIKNSDQKMIENAEAQDASMVVIRGKLVYVAPAGMIDVFSCKSVGLAVESIR